MTESHVFGKNVGVLDTTDVTSGRPKTTSGHSAAAQTTDRKDLLAVAGSLPGGLNGSL